MINLLVKLFIKNPDNYGDQVVRTNYGILVSITGVFCNLILFITKLLIGLMINSISVLADAFNNLSDAASSIISFVGIKLANRPADKEHPFGHGRYEYIAAFIVAFLVLQVGFNCLQSSVSKIMNPELLSSSFISIIILSFSILLKIWLGLFNQKLGNKINSAVMKATAADAFGDVLITSATILSVIIGMLTNLNIDGYTGVIVSIFVLKSGINIIRETLEPLLGQAVRKDDYIKISSFVERYEHIVGSHDLIIHNYGPSNTMATIHAEVPKDIDIETAHEIIDQIERDAKRELGIALVIHMDPIATNDQHEIQLKKIVCDVVNSLDERASIHDFRIVNGSQQHINLIFDLVTPYSYTEKEEHMLLDRVVSQLSILNSKYQCIITIEHSFISED